MAAVTCAGTAGEQILELMNVLKSLKDIISPTYFNGEQMVLTLLDLGVTAKLFLLTMPLPITEKQRFQDLLQPIFLFTAYEGYCSRIAAMMECLNDMYLKYK